MLWTKTSDGLPDYNTRVLVYGVENTNKEPSIHVAHCYIVDWFDKGDIRNGLSWCSSHAWGTEPTYWMPLPDPPLAEPSKERKPE